MKQLFRNLTILFLLSTPSLLSADTLSLTTYYPAPFGSYNLLKLTPNTDASMGVCDSSKTGLFYLSSNSFELKICTGTAWSSTNPWTLNTTTKIVYLTTSDTDTAYKAGIGTSTPDTRFHVKGIDDTTHGQLKIESTGAEAQLTLLNLNGQRAKIIMSDAAGSEGLRFVTNNIDRLVIDENGNVGIGGITAPDTALEVKGGDNANFGQLEVKSAANDARISLYNSAGASATGRGDIMMSRTAASEGLRFLINGADKMIIDETGNVGIGLTAPAALFDIARNPAAGIVPIAKFDNMYLMDENGAGYTSNALCNGTNCASTDTSFMGVRMYGDSTNLYNMTLGVPFSAGDNSSISLNVGNVSQLIASRTAVVTDSSVNVGIGIAAPVYKLHVNGTIGGKLDSANPTFEGELKVDCKTTPGSCYAVYAP